jgi:mono/diheme cytochrome c family protein
MTNFRKTCFVLGGCLLLWLTISAQAQEKLCDTETSFGRSDKTLYGKQCAICHSLSGQWRRAGPRLGDIFKQKELVTGQPVDKENIRAIISKGIPGLMPGFRYTLTPREIDELIAYLQRVSCPNITSSSK